MKVRCEGGMLDGREVEVWDGQEKVSQSGATVLRIHFPEQPRKQVRTRLLTYWDEYTLHLTEDGPVYRCATPFGGVRVGETLLEPDADGGYDVYADRTGKLHATWPEA